MKRREFVSRAVAGMVALSPALTWTRRFTAAPWLLVPMDDTQSDHLKAYGLAYRVLKQGAKAEWFLNYRGGAFLLPGNAATLKRPTETPADAESATAGEQEQVVVDTGSAQGASSRIFG